MFVLSWESTCLFQDEGIYSLEKEIAYATRRVPARAMDNLVRGGLGLDSRK